MTADETTNTAAATTTTADAAAPTAKAKKGSKKPVAKKAAAKKTAPAAKKAAPKKVEKAAAAKHSTRGGKFSADSTIKLLGKDSPYRGKRADLFKLMKDGMTVVEYLEAMKKKFGKASTRPIQRALASGLIKVS